MSYEFVRLGNVINRWTRWTEGLNKVQGCNELLVADDHVDGDGHSPLLLQ